MRRLGKQARVERTVGGRRVAWFWRIGAVALALACSMALAAGPASAANGPGLVIKARWGDTNLPPGGVGQFALSVRNAGDQGAALAPVTVTDQLPAGVTATVIGGEAAPACSGVGTETVTCAIPPVIAYLDLPAPGITFGKKGGKGAGPDGYLTQIFIDVAVDPSATGTGTNVATVSGGGSPTYTDTDPVTFSATPSSFGIVPGSFEVDPFDGKFPFGQPLRQAGAHPYELRVNFDLNQETGLGEPNLVHGASKTKVRYTGSHGRVKDVEVTLPRGFIGNPEATPKCDPALFAAIGATGNSTLCPADTQVGYLNIPYGAGTDEFGYGPFNLEGDLLQRVAIYNLVPPRGQTADFAFNAGGYVQGHIYPVLDPAQDYAIKTISPGISNLVTPRGAEVTFWGVPGDPSHDVDRYLAIGAASQNGQQVAGAPFGGAAIRPLLTNPSDCGFDNGGARIRADSYNDPGDYTPVEEAPTRDNVSGCDDPRFRFKPEVALRPTDRRAGAPTGLDVHLKVPQRDDAVQNAGELYAQNGDVQAIATPPIKKAVVTFPLGMTISPSAAQGLGSCSAAQIGLGTDAPVTCPDNSQYGTLTLHTPILPVDAQPEGWIYIAKQSENPFHNFLSLYLVIQEPARGILVKIPARVDLDQRTGQITTTFDDLPQFPVSDMQLTLKGGVRAALVNPQTCGTKSIDASFYTWQDPRTPHTSTSSYDVTEKPDGSPCVADLGARPFGPSFTAGTVNNAGGSYSPFAMRLTRTDGDQEFSQLGLTMPEGLLGKLAGVASCPDAAIAQAEARVGAGQGALEQAQPSCPAASLIGHTEVGVGVGVPLVYVPGKVYLAGPYRGAPLSLVVISPAVVGPYDLGVIAVRSALNIDPVTTRVSAQTDPLPQIFQGIPVRIRDIRLDLARPDFTLNPTSCAEKRIEARLFGSGGDVDSIADDTALGRAERFQAADCAALGFKPKLSLRLFGGTHRGALPRLVAKLRMRRGDADIRRASVALPHSEFLEQGHIKTVCTRVQFAAEACPQRSIYGHAEAFSPLLDQPLRGPVYLRSSNHKLPDLVAALRGPANQPIEVDLDGRIDSFHGGIRATFEVVPDAPVSLFVLRMQGGKKGLLINSRNICERAHRATANFRAQNGRIAKLHPKLRAACKRKHRPKKKHASHTGKRHGKPRGERR